MIKGAASPVTGPDRIGAARLEGRAEIVASYGGRVVALRDLLGDDVPASTREAIGRWEELAPRLADPGAAPTLDQDALEWAPPVMPQKLICVGANYGDHLAEMERAGAPRIEPTPFPFSFLKPPSTGLVGSGQPVAIPAFGEKLDWEAELAVVIGDPTRAAADPLGAVFGYAIMNELSLRDFVAPFPHPLGLDAVISKGFDGSAPLGPWITLADRVPDPTALRIDLRVDGEPRQRSSTAQMIFSVEQLVAYYARVLTLEVGDVIATGTPAGVGAGMQPPRFLEPGELVEVEIEGLGKLTTPIVAATHTTSLTID